MTGVEQVLILNFLAPRDEGLTLAFDVAAELEIPPRGVGAKLAALERRGLVRRQRIRHKEVRRRMYGWEITDRGETFIRYIGVKA